MEEDLDNSWKKRNREKVFEEDSSLRMRRNQPDSLQKSILYFYSDPPSIAEQLAFSVKRKKDTFDHLICKIKNGFLEGQMEKIGKCTEELGKMITADPRLGHFLQVDFLELLVDLLKSKRYSNLQAQAATIFKPVVTFLHNRKDVVVVIEHIIPIVLKLICFGVYVVRVEALWLLRTLVFAISKSRVEEILAPVTSLIIEDSISFNVLHAASETLLVTCEEHPKLSREKLKLALPALIKLIESNILMLLTSGCAGLVFLCDGREEMIVEDKYLERLITRLVDIMNSTERIVLLSALHAMGSIVRWGSDDVIETIIKEDGALLILLVLLDEDDLYIVKQTCWILSNITARKEKHIRAVIDGVTDGNLIDPLVKVVLNCIFEDVRKEAVWAISNAMCGVGIDQIECLRNSCSKIDWSELLFSFSTDRLFFLVTLEGLVNIKVAKVTWNGRPIDGVELHSIFKNITDDSDWLTGYKIILSDGKHMIPIFPNYEKSDDNVYVLVFKFEFEGEKCSQIYLIYDSSIKYFIC